MKKIAFLLAIFLYFYFSSMECNAGGPPMGPPMGPPPCWPPPCAVPIDGGIGILIAAGAALGGKKLYDLRKSPSKSE